MNRVKLHLKRRKK